MITTVNISNTTILNIEGLFSGHSFELILEHVENDEITPINYVGNYKLVICRDNFRKEKVMELTVENGGLVISGNLLTIRRSAAENKMQQGTYYFDLHDDVSSQSSYPFVRGTIKVIASR